MSLLNNQNKKMSEIVNKLPKTFQTPTMAPFCKDEEKYQLVEKLVKQIQLIVLALILVSTVVAIGLELRKMFIAQSVELADLLLMFLIGKSR